jgi:hypothetical protein
VPSGAIQVTAAGGGGTGGGGAVTAVDGALVTEGATTDAESASGNGTIVALLKRLRTLLNGGLPAALAANGGLKIEGVASGTAVPVSGSFFQGTQPVSLATNTPDVTDRAARLLGHVTVDAAPTTAVTGPLTDTQLRASAVPVSGTFFQATQPVSLATNTPDVTDRAARLLGHVTVDAAPTTAVTGTVTVNQGTAAATAAAWPAKITDGTNVGAVKAASVLAAATDPAQVVQQSPMRSDASTLAVTATGLTGAAVTLTLPAPAAGLFHYVTSIEITKFASALLVAGATPVLVTTTNLPGSPVYSFSAAASAAGTIDRYQVTPTTPLKSSVAATATTIVCPVATTTIWRVNVTYYTAP